MTARYHVLASDELMATDGLQWPEGLRPVEQEDPGRYPGMHWWLLEDDGAPAWLDGLRVELGLGVEVSDGDARSVVADRWVMGGP
jgi:hypothetical protein